MAAVTVVVSWEARCSADAAATRKCHAGSSRHWAREEGLPIDAFFIVVFLSRRRPPPPLNAITIMHIKFGSVFRWAFLLLVTETSPCVLSTGHVPPEK